MDSVLQVGGVSKVFDATDERVVALENVTLDVADGEFVSLIGPSGCGKSTLLNLMGGLTSPTTGTVWINGREVLDPPPEVGMMFQRPVLLDWRSALQNVVLPIEAQQGRRAAKRLAGRAEELLAQVGLAEFVQRYPSELSGGMQQRVAICRMLIANPEVLLLDEPFGALDELTREHMNVELANIVSQQRKAAVLVTHNIAEAIFLADRVEVMTPRPGRIAGTIPVPLQRPRRLEVLTSEHFLDLVRQVRELLEEGVEGARL